MSDRIGIEISLTRARAVALAAWGDRPRVVADIDWDAAHPETAVAALQGRFGRAGRIALAIGLEHLHVKHVELPPAPRAVRREMLAVEPDRFFPVGEERVVVSLDGDVAFAGDQAMIDRWVEAFETWAPVESVEAAPVALARALASEGDATYVFPLGESEGGVVELRGGRLVTARHTDRSAWNPSWRALPTIRSVTPTALTAWGAARGLDGDPGGMMLGASQRATVGRRRARRLAGAAAAWLLAAGFASWALDRSRDDVLARLTARQESLESRAAPAAALQARIASLDREDAVVREVLSRRADPLRVLAALGEKLPRDVTVLNARASENEWRIDGTATNAAAILPALDGDSRFADARFLGATSRFRESGKTYESFSLAFHVKP